MAADFYIVKLVDTGKELTKSFFAAKGQKRKKLYDEMFPLGCYFEEPYNPRGCLWTVKLNPKKLQKHLKLGLLEVDFVPKLLQHCENNRVEITVETIQNFIDKWEFASEYEKFVRVLNTPEGLSNLQEYYNKRRNAWIQFLRRAVMEKSEVEVSLNL